MRSRRWLGEVDRRRSAHHDPRAIGTPVRLRVESQLGDKIVMYLRSIELIADDRGIGEGQDGSREDTMFYGRGAAI
ncbi:MAG TPA: hypothetical protein VIG44_12390 [Thermomicrobiales bacterium]|jgi:hypothetical protein